MSEFETVNGTIFSDSFPLAFDLKSKVKDAITLYLLQLLLSKCDNVHRTDISLSYPIVDELTDLLLHHANPVYVFPRFQVNFMH